MKITIQSISDIITNSSSEVFVISSDDSNKQEIYETIKEIVDTVCEASDYHYDEEYSEGVFLATEDKKAEDAYNVEYEKGDTYIIWEDMPYFIQLFIEDYLEGHSKLGNRNLKIRAWHHM